MTFANITNKEVKKEKRVCSYVSLIIVGVFLVNILGALSSVMGIAYSETSVVVKLLMGGFFITIIPIILQRFTVKMMIVTLVSILVTLLNLLFFQKNTSIFVDTAMSYYTMCFTGFLAISSIRDKNILKESLLKFSRIIGLICIVLMIGIISGAIERFNNGDYSMGLGYACLIPLLNLICAFIEKQKVYDFLGIVGLLFLLISYGSRMPLLAVGLFGVFFVIRYLSANKKYLSCVCLCILILLLIVYYESILILLIEVLSNWGINSRTLNLIVYDLSHDSGRDTIYFLLLNQIVNHPFQIRGINAEYLVVGGYAHNLFLELIYQFGILLGGLAVLFLLIKFFKTISLKDYSEENLFKWIFFFASIPQLMFSSTLWTNIGFWLWFAMII